MAHWPGKIEKLILIKHTLYVKICGLPCIVFYRSEIVVSSNLTFAASANGGSCRIKGDLLNINDSTFFLSKVHRFRIHSLLLNDLTWLI